MTGPVELVVEDFLGRLPRKLCVPDFGDRVDRQICFSANLNLASKL
jgi:hypothetical protein